jgi:hypothetical protein
MSLRDQFQQLSRQASDFRSALFGANHSGTQQKFTCADLSEALACYQTPVKDKQQLEDANMRTNHDTIIRIKKADAAAAGPPFFPRLGQVITLLDAGNDGENLTVRFDEFGHTNVNPEFVIGCASV